MAVTATHLESNSGAAASSFNTGSLSLSSSQIVVVAVGGFVSGGLSNVPTLSLSGWTFNKIADEAGNANYRVSLWTGTGSGTGQITISFGGQSQTRASWSVAQFGNVAKSGTGGSDGVVQSVGNHIDSGQTSGTVTLGAFSSVNNPTIITIYKNATNVFVGSGSIIVLGQSGSGTTRLALGWQDSNNTTPTMTFSGSGGDGYQAIGAELKYRSSAGFFGFM